MDERYRGCWEGCEGPVQGCFGEKGPKTIGPAPACCLLASCGDDGHPDISAPWPAPGFCHSQQPQDSMSDLPFLPLPLCRPGPGPSPPLWKSQLRLAGSSCSAHSLHGDWPPGRWCGRSSLVPLVSDCLRIKTLVQCVNGRDSELEEAVTKGRVALCPHSRCSGLLSFFISCIFTITHALAPLYLPPTPEG